jgi:restriction system protein
MTEVQEMNQDLEQEIHVLEKLLVDSLGKNPAIDFEALKVNPKIPTLDLSEFQKVVPIPEWSHFEPKRPHPLVAWIPKVRNGHETRTAQSRRDFQVALERHKEKEAERRDACERKVQEHKAKEASIKAAADRKNAELDQWRSAVESGDKEALEEYFDQILSESDYPDGFPREGRLAYVRESKQLVIEYDLPLLDDVIPTAKGFAYVKASDTVNEAARPEKQRRSLYASVVAQTTLRCLREMFATDIWSHIDTLVLNGFVATTDPGTGNPIRPCLVTVRTTRERFMGLNLAAVDPIAALQYLSASFSKSPAELAPVRPLLEFNMVDHRFIKEDDVISTLDQRPNLMDLSPGEFESLITNLFKKMGLEARLTQASRDGGVDCVAFDPRPIFGGKVVIQAKRYKNTVGVSAVRDLFGTMQNEGASKGILVATSGYGKAAFDFANGKPMELLDGGNLLHLLKEHADIDAKIVMPEDWRDPDLRG